MTYEDVRLQVLQAAQILGVGQDSPAFTEAMTVIAVAEADGYEPSMASEIARDILSRSVTEASQVA